MKCLEDLREGYTQGKVKSKDEIKDLIRKNIEKYSSIERFLNDFLYQFADGKTYTSEGNEVSQLKNNFHGTYVNTDLAQLSLGASIKEFKILPKKNKLKFSDEMTISIRSTIKYAAMKTTVLSKMEKTNQKFLAKLAKLNNENGLF